MSFLIVIDCEMTGTMVTEHALINIGLTLMNVETEEVLDGLDLVLNVPEGKVWDEEVIEWAKPKSEIAEIIRIVKAGKGLSVKEAMDQFCDFLWKYNKIYGEELVIGCDRLEVDATWLNYYLSLCGKKPLRLIFGKIKHVIDICSYHQGCSGMTHRNVREFSNTGKKFSANVAAFKHLNIRDWYPQHGEQYTHRAIHDSELIAKGHCKVLKAIETLQSSYIPSSWVANTSSSSQSALPSTVSLIASSSPPKSSFGSGGHQQQHTHKDHLPGSPFYRGSGNNNNLPQTTCT